MGSNVVRSPFPYAGNKKRVLEKGLKAILHDAVGESGLVWDMMTGSGSVILNSRNGGYAYDIDPYVIGMHQLFTRHPDPVSVVTEVFLQYFDGGVLSEKGYYALREEENKKHKYGKHRHHLWLSDRHAAILLILAQLGFNSLFRFGPNGFNTPYGHEQKPFDMGRIKEAVDRHEEIPITFFCAGFKAFDWSAVVAERGDVVYFDPPYYVSEGSHTYSHWPLFKEMALRSALAELDSRNRRFILSNVAVYRGVRNTSLLNFAEEAGFNVYVVPGVKYKAWSAVKGTDTAKMGKTQEILVTNFEIGGF